MKIAHSNLDGVSGFPIEILQQILYEFNDYGRQIELPARELDAYLNRYTRAAKVARRVCRTWRELVDMPSNHHFRLTTAFLTTEGESSCHFRGLEQFRHHLLQSRSMLAISLEISLWWGLGTQPYPISGTPLVSFQEVLMEINRLLLYHQKLVKFRVRIGDPDPLGRQICTLESTTVSQDLIIESYKIEHPPPGSFNIFTDLNLPVPIELGEGISQLFRHPNSLRCLDLRYGAGSRQIILLPTSLTQLVYRGWLLDLYGALQTCPTLKGLTVNIPNSYEPALDEQLQGRRQPIMIELPILKSLNILGPTQYAREFMSKLRSPSLENLTLSAVELFSPYDLQSLKVLELKDILFIAHHRVSNLSFPPVEKCIISDARFGISDGSFEPPGAGTLIECRCLEGVWSELRHFFLSMHFVDATPIQQLYITIVDAFIYHISTIERVLRLIHFPNLEIFVFAGHNLQLMSRLLQYLSPGNALSTLELRLIYKMNRSPTAWPLEWKTLVSKLSQKGTYSSVRTLIIAWEPDFMLTVFDLCTNTRKLVVKRVPGGLDSAIQSGNWLFAALAQSGVVTDGTMVAALLSLEDIVLEFEEPLEMEVLEELMRTSQHVLPAFLAVRRDFGAKTLVSVTLRSFTESELAVPDAREVELDSGVQFRLEVVDKPSA
jgi:hypothetical protein